MHVFEHAKAAGCTTRDLVGRVALYALLALASFGSAQGDDAADAIVVPVGSYAGASIGADLVLIYPAFPVTVHLGIGDEGFGARIDASVYLPGTSFRFAANALYRGGTVAPDELRFYGGGGVRLIASPDAPPVFGGGALGGSEYVISSSLGVFAEVDLDFYYAEGLVLPIYGLRFGPNVYF